MGKFKLNSMFKSINGSAGGHTYSKWKGEDVFRGRITESHQPNTRKQQRVRSRFIIMAETWNGLHLDKNKIFLESWNLFALEVQRNLSGYNLFVRFNYEHFQKGEPFELSKFFNIALTEEEENSMEPLTVGNFQVTPGAADGSFSCAFDAVPVGWHLSIYTQELVDGVITSNIARHDFGAAPASPVVINGLNPGMEYYVYAVITCGTFLEATGISDSVAVKVTAPGSAPAPAPAP